MEKKNIKKIVEKYLPNRFSPEIEERIQKWMIKGNDNNEKEQASFAYWSELKVEANPCTYSALKRVNRRIGYSEKPIFLKVFRIVAVIIPICFIVGGYLYYTSAQQHRLIEISVAYGQSKHLLLPDSSEIWINAGSIIKYPKEFSKKQRVVILDGEAYFSIRKNSSRPFIVQTKQLSVKVLGTKFNVKSYLNDDYVTTTLTSGQIEVKTLSNYSQILKPNEQLTYNKNTLKIKVEKVSPTEAEGWITGNLLFVNAPFSEIIKTLERRFNMSIEYRDSIPVSKLYTVKFMKRENLYEALDILEEMVGFTYRVENNKIMID